MRSCNFKFESKRCKISLFVSTFELWKIWYALLPKESIVATAIENFSSALVSSSNLLLSSYCSCFNRLTISFERSGVKDIISTYNTTLDTDILSNNFYDFKIYAIPKSSSKERSSDVSVEYINIDELSEEQKKEIERNIIAVREKTVLEHLPQKFADAIKQKIEKVSSKKISSYIASYHLSTLMKKLGWKSNKEYRTTNKTYGRDYYTEKARVELFKKIDEDYESIVRLSNAHFVE